MCVRTPLDAGNRELILALTLRDEAAGDGAAAQEKLLLCLGAVPGVREVLWDTFPHVHGTAAVIHEETG